MTPVVWAPSGQRALHLHSGAVDLLMGMLWMALNAQVTWCGLKEMGKRILCWTPLQLTRLFWDPSLLSPLGHATLLWLLCTGFSNFVSAGKLWPLFGLREDELLPDLHITGAGVLRIGLGAHQEDRVNHEARADRTRVPAEVIQLAAHEVDPEPDKQNDPPSSLASDAEQYELMQASYVAVGKDFHDQEDLIGSEYSKLRRLELVPERWPLARLSFSLQKCVDHLDRVLAGCCWEVHATRVAPPESLPSLHWLNAWLCSLLCIWLKR